MNDNIGSIASDISAFADIGTSEVSISTSESGWFTEIVRNGVATKLSGHPDGSVKEVTSDFTKLHASFRALLASENFADLGRWAESQQTTLRAKVAADTISVTGTSSKTGESGSVQFLDDHLVILSQDRPRVLITLIDGPAGIGKTSMLRALAMRRAQDFRRHQRPLLLHVESRGRMLQNITDLMAFSLQTLRVQVTYDQIPVLVRHGLILLAIDGFDELGDPSGYDLAWAQVNELVAESRGTGNIILAGRETFIGEGRILSAINSIDIHKDVVLTFSLNTIIPAAAKNWLKEQGWTQADFEADVVAPIFEEGSYALRPFFLSELARAGTLQQITAGKVTHLLTFLVEAMLQREATKFGTDIEALSTASDRERFVRILMEEVARDLAENQSVSISSENLAWLSEAAASEIFPPSVWGMLKNRAGVIAFLAEDDRRGYKKFIHEQVFDYFLSHVTINSVRQGETAKFIRRNILGLEFLESFAEVARRYESSDIEVFAKSAQAQILQLGGVDRAKGNLASLLIAAASVTPLEQAVVISDLGIDEAWAAETVSAITMERVAVGQLYARGADLRSITFVDACFVVTLVADEGTVLPESMPAPSILSLPNRTMTDPGEILSWVRQHRPNTADLSQSISFSLSNFGLFPLFTRLVRCKPFWLKLDDTRGTAKKILEDPNWGDLRQIMLKHNFLVERFDVPASGPKEAFYHVRRKGMLLGQEAPDAEMEAFLRDLVSRSIDVEGGTSQAAKKLAASYVSGPGTT